MSTEVRSARSRQPDSSAHRTSLKVLRYAGVAALLVSAIVHAVLAPGYGAGQPGITLGAGFVVQALFTAVIAVWLLVRDAVLAWIIGAAVMGGTLAALLLAHTENGIPELGPIPGLQEQTYDGPQLVTLIAQAAFLLLAVARVLIGRQRKLASVA